MTGANLKANWTTHGLKYSTKTEKAIEKATDSSEYKFTETENGEIDVHVPTVKELAGVFAVTFAESNYKTTLDDLTVTVQPDDFDFTADGVGMSRTISVVFSEKKIDGIYYIDELDQGQGMYWSNGIYTNGLRHIVPEGGKAVVVNVTGYYWAEQVEPQIASVKINYYNGSFTNPGDGRPGGHGKQSTYRTPETANGSNHPSLSRPNEKLYTGEGVTFHFEPDTDHGYIISINGKEYYDIHTCGYGPDVLEVDGEKIEIINDTELDSAKWDVYLNDLVDVEGYLGIGATSNKYDKNENKDYTIKTINGIPAAQWKGETNIHECIASETIHILAPTCSTFGIDVVKCTECGAVISYEVLDQLSPTGAHIWNDWTVTKEAACTETGLKTHICSICSEEENAQIAALAHNWSDWKVTKEATCSEAGLKTHICSFCGNEESTQIATSDHSWSQWTVTKEATFIEAGKSIRTCAICGATETNAIQKKNSPFKDIELGKWYTDPCLWAFENDLMSGMTADTFAPNAKLTRAQFVQILAKLEGIDTTKIAYQAKFSDVPAGKWFTGAVMWAVDFGVTGGIGNGQFGPNANVTRAQLATFFFAYATKKGCDMTKTADISNYTDVAKVPNWAKNAMSWAVGNSLISSAVSGQKVLDPNALATRAQVAVIFKAFATTLHTTK